VAESLGLEPEELLPELHPLFRSFFQAGFECSCHRNRFGQRLNLLESSQHTKFALRDFHLVKAFGMKTVRTAICWPFIEETPGEFDFTSVDKLLDASDEAGVELLIDLLHFGWPDHVDVFAASFPEQFAAFASEFAQYLKRRGVRDCLLAPVNEVSFLSWAGGDKAAVSPLTIDRGHEFKRNLIRAAAACSEVLLNELPGVRLIAPEPAIHIVGDPEILGDVEEATAYTHAQFESWDMLSGRLAPELGGRPEYLDIIGVNFYERNEWVHNSTWIPHTDPRYRPFHHILQDIWNRYNRPMFVSETGTEDDRRAPWFNYICDEVELAQKKGVPIHGICLYPIANHPGWDDDRHCHNGLFDYPDAEGDREVYQPLADALLQRQSHLSRRFKEKTHVHNVRRPDLLFTSPMGIRFPAAAASDEPLCSEP
jgi:hypothetical protein